MPCLGHSQIKMARFDYETDSSLKRKKVGGYVNQRHLDLAGGAMISSAWAAVRGQHNRMIAG